MIWLQADPSGHFELHSFPIPDLTCRLPARTDSSGEVPQCAVGRNGLEACSIEVMAPGASMLVGDRKWNSPCSTRS